MSTFSTDFQSAALRDLNERGFIQQISDPAKLDRLLETPQPVFAGFDATADSLHVGHMLPLLCLRRLQRAGHKPIVLIGGGTTQIGDPSFRLDGRPLLSLSQIAQNKAGIRRCFEAFLTFGDGPSDAILVDNADWLGPLSLLPFLREIGRHFPVGRMLTMDSVKARLGSDGLSFLEFSYMLLQATDFLELSRRFCCRLQVGGTDQWGNIVNGIELIRRADQEEAFGLTTPLLTKSDGTKMGKTASGAVWLNPDRLAPFAFWQFWRNVEDAKLAECLRLFTDLPPTDIAQYTNCDTITINQGKIILANAVTTLVHGADTANAAASAALEVTTGRRAPDGLPEHRLDAAALHAGLGVVDLLVQTGLCSSKGEARRLISGRGARLNLAVICDAELCVGPQHLDACGTILLSAGRKRHSRICVVTSKGKT
jgi:tyrosyl-tRNA synthetase